MIRRVRYTLLHTYVFAKMLVPHWPWLIGLPLSMAVIVLLNKTAGAAIPTVDWVWLDIIGEGGLALFMVMWMLIVLATREPGFITYWLAFGFLCLCASSFQDMLDEIYVLPDTVSWDKWIESAPVGLASLVIGLILWYREQRQLKKYLNKRSGVLQNDLALHEDSLLPQWSALAKAVQDAPAHQPTLVVLRVAPEVRSQLPLTLQDQSKLRFLIAEMLLWNSPDASQVFQLTGEGYALLSAAPVSQEQINDVVLLLRSMRFRGKSHKQATLLEVKSRTLILENALSDSELRNNIQQVQADLASTADGIVNSQSIANVHVV